MEDNQTFFRRKILAFTVIQVVLLSFLLFLSVVVRVFLYPHNYLESYPLYAIVGFFFVWEMLQFAVLLREKGKGHAPMKTLLWRAFLLRIPVALAAGYIVCFCLSGQTAVSVALFLIFFVAELLFEVVYYRNWMD